MHTCVHIIKSCFNITILIQCQGIYQERKKKKNSQLSNEWFPVLQAEFVWLTSCSLRLRLWDRRMFWWGSSITHLSVLLITAERHHWHPTVIVVKHPLQSAQDHRGDLCWGCSDDQIWCISVLAWSLKADARRFLEPMMYIGWVVLAPRSLSWKRMHIEHFSEVTYSRSTLSYCSHVVVLSALSFSAIHLSTVFAVMPRFLRGGPPSSSLPAGCFCPDIFFRACANLCRHVTKLIGNWPVTGCNREHCI